MSNPKVSVITVVYNDYQNIEQTIMSVLSQTYTNYEYIVIDGSSSDGTVDVIKRHLNNITKFISEPDNGIYDAMNKGIQLSMGEWIMFMNSGDVFYDNRVLEHIFQRSIPKSCKLIYGDVVMKYPNDMVINRMNITDKKKLPFCLCHQSTLTSGDYLRSHPYDLSYKICADAKSFYEIMSKFGYLYIDETLSVYEASDGMSSKNIYSSFKEQCDIQGLRRGSINYISGSFKAIIKVLLSKFLGKRMYSSFMSMYIKRNNK